jgi:hypothetical protein
MVVTQVRLERAGARKPAARLRAFQFNVEGRDFSPPLGSCNRSWVAHEPKIATRIIFWRKDTARFRPAHHAEQLDAVGRDASLTRRRILLSLRDEAAIDDDKPAARELGRRERPVAGSENVAAQGRTARVNERLGARHEYGGEFHAAELVVCGIKLCPVLAGRQIDRRC